MILNVIVFNFKKLNIKKKSNGYILNYFYLNSKGFISNIH